MIYKLLLEGKQPNPFGFQTYKLILLSVRKLRDSQCI